MRVPNLLVLPVLIAALLLAGAFAGCTDDTPLPATAKIEAGLITPGAWIVNGKPDHILAWAHNQATTAVTIGWHMEFANGTDTPASWKLSSEAPVATLQANHTKTRLGGQVEYPDWAWTLFTIEIPDDTPGAEHKMVLDTGKTRHEFTMKIAANRSRVSHPQDEVELHYDGKFHNTGQTFDDGEFSTTLGSGQTVPGFDYGLMGLAVGENAALILPPPLGYGYDQTQTGYTKFNGQTLRFEVKILKFV
jgi:hypothetical protein